LGLKSRARERFLQSREWAGTSAQLAVATTPPDSFSMASASFKLGRRSPRHTRSRCVRVTSSASAPPRGPSSARRSTSTRASPSSSVALAVPVCRRPLGLYWWFIERVVNEKEKSQKSRSPSSALWGVWATRSVVQGAVGKPRTSLWLRDYPGASQLASPPFGRLVQGVWGQVGDGRARARGPAHPPDAGSAWAFSGPSPACPQTLAAPALSTGSGSGLWVPERQSLVVISMMESGHCYLACHRPWGMQPTGLGGILGSPATLQRPQTSPCRTNP